MLSAHTALVQSTYQDSHLLLLLSRPPLSPIFNNKMPALSSLVITHVWLPWLCFANLSWLILPDQPTPSLSQLASTLQKCPALQSLCLSLNDPEFCCDPLGTFVDKLPIEVLQLINMLLIAPHDVVASLLQLLHFSLAVIMVLSLQHILCLRVMVSHNVVHHVQQAQLDMYVHAGWHGLRISTVAGNHIQVQWDWREKINPFDNNMWLEHLGDLVQFTGVEYLKIRHMQYFLFEQDWLYVLQQMPVLKHIELNCCFIGSPMLFGTLSQRITNIQGQVSPEGMIIPEPHLVRWFHALSNTMTIMRIYQCSDPSYRSPSS